MSGSAFFVHVMKTGGTSFVQHAEANLPPEAIWPRPGVQSGLRAGEGIYGRVDVVLGLDPEERARVRFYSGHMPSVVAELIGATTTLTVLRDPVERAISYLRHARRILPEMRDRTLVEVYDDPWQHGFFINDYQVRQFAKRPGDDLLHIGLVEIDGPRMELALANLERIDVVGLQEEYPDFERRAVAALGWHWTEVARLRTSEDREPVPDGLRERIRADNAADVAFYEHAVELVRRRARDAAPGEPGRAG